VSIVAQAVTYCVALFLKQSLWWYCKHIRICTISSLTIKLPFDSFLKYN